VTEALDFVQRHAQVLLFIWIFIDQLGVPIPAVPLLLAAGAPAGAGTGSLVTTVGIALMASLLADVVWSSVGRRRGHHVLTWLCRITLEPDSCVRRTEEMFAARGLQALLVTKFLPPRIWRGGAASCRATATSCSTARARTKRPAPRWR